MIRLAPARLLVSAGSIAVVCVLMASASYAAPPPRRAGAGWVCDPQPPVGRKLPRHVKSFGGPLASQSKHSLAGLIDPASRLRRCSQTKLDDDDEAIQNDSPAA